MSNNEIKWNVFKGSGDPHDGIDNLPDPPAWRSLDGTDRKKKRGEDYQVRPNEINMVNAALYLRRPLLVTGKPGTGKTSLAFRVAYELQLGELLYWPITSRSTLEEGLYRYDAIGRAQDKGLSNNQQEAIGNIVKYLTLGPLGTAFLPRKQAAKQPEKEVKSPDKKAKLPAEKPKPRVLLIDEIDKSDIDLPNNLLHLFEEGRYEIRELKRIAGELPKAEIRTADKADVKATISGGEVQCDTFPFVIMTSNGERDFPPAFLRRCVRLHMTEPNSEELEKIVNAHFDSKSDKDNLALEQSHALREKFLELRAESNREALATDQLLNVIYLLSRGPDNLGEDGRKELIDQILKPLASTED
jgi:MoxR-like ATPase